MPVPSDAANVSTPHLMGGKRKKKSGPKSKTTKRKVSAKIAHLIHKEGMKQDHAVAVAHQMWRDGKLR